MAAIILKVTEQCNSNCYYCDVVFKQNTGTSMPLEVLEMVFRRSDEYLKQCPAEKITMIWHGGEPLLLGPDYYASALEFQDRHCPTTKSRIDHSIQTNLTCFKEDFVAIFQKLGITSVGTSYDPIPRLRGPGQQDSEKYNRMFMDALALLRRKNIDWGMIYVVTKKTLEKPLDVFFFLTNLQPRGAIMFNPVLIYDDQRKDVAITPEEFVEFLGAIFPVWWKYRDRYPEIEPFKSLAKNIIEKKHELSCNDSGACSHSHINITPDGETSQCGRSADWNLLLYGNIRNKSLEEILDHPLRAELHGRSKILRENDCKECIYWELCHGGCPLDSFSQHKSFLHKSEWCGVKAGFIEKYFEPVTGAKFTPSEGANVNE